jgi:hypothetical protein
MKNTLLIVFILFVSVSVLAQETKKKDTVSLGIYITSIHDIDFKNQEYDISFWMWMNYDFKKKGGSVFENKTELLHSLEIPQAKSTEMTFIDSSVDNHVLAKVHCVMKDNWNIKSFPFDHQKLRLSLENASYDSSQIKFIIDSSTAFYDTSASSLKYNKTIHGWKIEKITFRNGADNYYTMFGEKPDAEVSKKKASLSSVYSAAKFVVEIERESWSVFWKIIICMYISFFISYVSFFISHKSVESRLGLSVGALFAVIGNKYIVEASLPESATFTLVDMLHTITMFFVLLIISLNIVSIRYINNNHIVKAMKFDLLSSKLVLALYLIINVAIIMNI